jgi:hypothetical protein
MINWIRPKPLSVCLTRCAELIHNLDGILQFQDLQQQIKALLSSLLSMLRTVDPSELDQHEPDPTYSPGLSLLAAYLHELDKTCGYYGTCVETEWQLSDEHRAFVLAEMNNPFNRIAGVLSQLARILQADIDDRQTDYHTKMHKLRDWSEGMFFGWHFFRGEIEAARMLAAAMPSRSRGQPTTENLTTTDGHGDVRSDKVLQDLHPESRKTSAWDQIGGQLAEEGIEDDAIKKVADDLKECARRLIRNERLKLGPAERQVADSSSKTSKTSATYTSLSSSISAEQVAGERIEALSNVNKRKAISAASENWFDCDFVSSKITASLDKIKSNFDLYLPEILVVTFKQESEKDSRNYRRALDLVYWIACRDTARSRVHARVAKEIQVRTPAKIREIMITKEDDTVQSNEGPVTGYLLKKCSADWDHGKNGGTRASMEIFALGLSRFIGELAKFGLFTHSHVHSFIRAQWGPTLNRNQFIAVYKLLRTTGPMLDAMCGSNGRVLYSLSVLYVV